MGRIGISKKEWITFSAEETIELGILISKTLKPNAVICLFGELASGKTTFAKGIIHGYLGIPLDEITSPTFMVLNAYHSHDLKAFHFDLYRLNGADEFLSSGFEEYFFQGGITVIEWSEKIEKILPSNAERIVFSHQENGRRIQL